MHICLLSSTFPSSPNDTAHATVLLQVIELLQRAGHRVSVLTQAREPDPSPPLPGLEVTWFDWRQRAGRLAELSFSSPAGLLSASSLLYQGARHVRRARLQQKVDLFFCCWVIPSGFYTYVDSLLGSRVPYVLWALGSDVNKYKSNPLMRNVLTRIIRGAGHVYADGFRLRDEINEITGASCEFLPTFRTLPGDANREPRRSAREPRRFLYVGRHAPVKGTDVLVDALCELERLGGANYECTIVGDGDLSPGLRQKIAQAGLGERVRFAGRAGDEQLAAEYRAADCVVIPSRSESIPLVMSEALQNGLPLIVTDVGDMGDLARRYRLGQVVPPEQPRAMAEALKAFVSAPWQLDEPLQQQILAELTFETAAPKLLLELESLVDSARTGH